jgi:AcrR family transcriptional regulator
VTRTRKFQSKAKTADGQAQLRQRFVDAGKALLKEAPDDAPSLRKVAEVTGYSPSALYRYFATKADLMYAIREEFLERSVEAAKARIAGETSPTRQLRLGFEAMVGFWVDNPDDFRHVYSYRRRSETADAGVPAGTERPAIRSARQFCVALVRGFFAQHGVHPTDALIDEFTDSLVVATHGVVAIPLGSPSLNYCASEAMLCATIQAFVGSWTDFAAFVRSHSVKPAPTVEQFHAYIDAVARMA